MINYRFRSQKQSKENGLVTLENLIVLLGIKVSKSAINLSRFHNEYPSLTYLEETLNEWNVDTISVRITSTQLPEIPVPSIAHITENHETHFVVIKSVSSSNIEYVHPNKGIIACSLLEFEQKWTGIAMLVSRNEKSGEKEFERNNKEHRVQTIRNITLVLLTSTLFLCASFSEAFLTSNYLSDWLPLSFTLLMGSIFCLLLFAKQQNSAGELVNKFCEWKNGSNRVNCNEVLNSKWSKPFGIFDLISIGLVYFIGKTLAFHTLLISGEASFLLSSFATLSLFAVPFTLFSVFYQIKVIKVVCPLCMCVVVVLWLEFAVLFPNLLRFDWEPGVKSAMLMIISFSIPFYYLLINRSYFTPKLQVNHLKGQLLNFKKSPQILQQILIEGKSIQIPLNAENEIIMGNKSGSVSVLVLLNPYCESCAKAFNDLKELSRDFENLKIIIRLSVRNPLVGHFAYFIIKALLSDGNEKVIELLGNWFNHSEKNISTWKAKFFNNVYDNQEKIEATFSQWNAWEAGHGILKAPSFFIDGQQVPNLFSLLDFYPYFKMKLATV